MSKSIIISERDNIAAVMENGRVAEFFIHRGDMLLGDVYLGNVENILPSIDAAFVNLGGDRMGFLHASDVAGKGALKDKLKPKQHILVQIIKEPTGHKGPRVTTSISLPGRFLVLMPDEKGSSVSRKIVSAKERARLKSVVSLLKPAGVGVIIRTEAENQSEAEIQEDLELLLEKWNNIVSAADTVTPPNLLYRDQDLLYRVIREACTEDVKEIMVDTPFALHRTNQLLQSWNMGNSITVTSYKGTDPLLTSKGIDREIRAALQTKVNMPSGGYLYIQTTEALTVIDVNSGKFTSSATQDETIRKTNLEAVNEIARQLRLRNIGGMIIIDFIDMENRVDQLAIMEELELALDPDKAKPQVGQLSDLGLVELTRHRQGQSLAEIFTKKCPACSGSGLVIEEFNFASPPQEGEIRSKTQKLRVPQKLTRMKPNNNNQVNNRNNNNVNNNNANGNNVQKQTPDITSTLNEQKPAVNNIKKVNTSPALVASVEQKAKRIETPETQETIDITEEAIKQLFVTEGYIPNISRVIKFSAVPPRVAREHMSENYKMDVFSILQEIESAEFMVSETKEQPQQNHQPARAVPAPEKPGASTGVMQTQATRVNNNKVHNRYPQKHHHPRVQPHPRQEIPAQPVRPQEIKQPEIVESAKPIVETVEAVEIVKAVETIEPVKTVETVETVETVKEEAPVQESAPKKGRKPGNTRSSASRTTRKRPAPKSTKTQEPTQE